ncbi:hypothetical protein MTO96_019709 [Rhipicephalus appendiculatus]
MGHSWGSSNGGHGWGRGDNWSGLVADTGDSWGSSDDWTGLVGGEAGHGWSSVESARNCRSGGQNWSGLVGKSMADTKAGEARVAYSVAEAIAGETNPTAEANATSETVAPVEESSKSAGGQG